jgi:ubiquinone/menaquinone biosynthesis C-methylase UbiE
MGALEFDASLVDQLEVLYRKRDILRRRSLIHAAIDVQPGERVLDVGCGPGFYVSELLERVGAAGRVVGVDSSQAMLAVAAHRCRDHANVALHEGDATALPVDDAGFDRAISVQVLEYVPDTAAALAELFRALRPGGRLVVWDIDWTTVSWHAADGARMETVLRAWDAHLSHPALPRTLAGRLAAAGFDDVRAEGHLFATTEYTDEAYGVAAIPVIQRYVAGREEVGPDVAEAWAAEQRELGARGEFFFACVQFCFTATRPR